MKAKDLRERSTEDLAELKTSIEKDLFSHRMKNATDQLGDTSLLGKARKDFARTRRLVRERLEQRSQVVNAPAESGNPVYRRKLIGRIRSDKMDKTVIVEVVRFKREGIYKKYVRVRKRYKAHDEKNEFKTGDRVEIIESRPLSREKRWAVARLVDRPAEGLVT